MAKEASDVNADSTSSTESATAGGQQKDVIEESSTQSSSEQDVNAGESMADFVNKSLKAQDESTDGIAEESKVEDQEGKAKAEKSDSETESDAREDESAEASEKKDGEEADEKEDVGQDDNEKEHQEAVPYERFKEVNVAKQSAERQLTEAEPKLKNYDNIVRFCHEGQITPEQFHQALQVQSWINQGQYEKAAEFINKTQADIQAVLGNKLPEDLQRKVDDGKIELDDAKEIARLRAQTKLGEAKARQSEVSVQQQREADLKGRMDRAAQTWEMGKRKADPDYKPGTQKWDEVRDRYFGLLNTTDERGQYVNPIRDESDLSTLMERAYQDVQKRRSGRTTPKAATKKVLSSNGSSTTTGSKRLEDATSLSEAIGIGMRQRGYKVG